MLNNTSAMLRPGGHTWFCETCKDIGCVQCQLPCLRCGKPTDGLVCIACQPLDNLLPCLGCGVINTSAVCDNCMSDLLDDDPCRGCNGQHTLSSEREKANGVCSDCFDYYTAWASWQLWVRDFFDDAIVVGVPRTAW